MKTEEKVKIFEEEINLIKDDDLRLKTTFLVECLPDYFFRLPASSTGKYHPVWARGEDGLIKHTKACVRKFLEKLQEPEYSQIKDIYIDYAISALILHDGLKYGIEEQQYCVSDHSKIMSDYVLQMIPNDEQIKQVADLILTHMGKWNYDKYTGLVFAPIPSTQLQEMVADSDYLASRIECEIDFEKPLERI